MLFLSVYEHSIDAKNRLAIPAEIRALIDVKVHGDGWVAGPGPHGLLTLWPSGVFAEKVDPYVRDLLAPAELDEWRTMLFRESARLEMDSHGRIRLPERLLREHNLSSNVVIVGAGDALELMSADEWNNRSKPDRATVAGTWKRAAVAARSAPASSG